MVLLLDITIVKYTPMICAIYELLFSNADFTLVKQKLTYIEISSRQRGKRCDVIWI